MYVCFIHISNTNNMKSLRNHLIETLTEAEYVPLNKKKSKPRYGKQHSERYEKTDADFSTYLRQKYYNTALSSSDVSEIRIKYKKEKSK